MFGFLCMCALLGLMPTSGEHFVSIARLEICFWREMLTCSILMFPAVCLQRAPFCDASSLWAETSYILIIRSISLKFISTHTFSCQCRYKCKCHKQQKPKQYALYTLFLLICYLFLFFFWSIMSPSSMQFPLFVDNNVIFSLTEPNQHLDVADDEFNSLWEL